MLCCNLRLILLVVITLVVTTLAEFNEKKCMRKIAKLKKPRITEEFPKIVVHGVHSMTLANLRHYFDRNAPANNNIPVINFNLSSSEPSVLLSTPDIPLHNTFTIPAMDALDQTLSHMTDNDWGIRNAPPLERVVHAIHMLEVWKMAAPFYKKLKNMKKQKRKQKIHDICPCLTAVEDNGIMDSMKDLAKKMRDTRVIWRYGICKCCYGYGGRPNIFSRQAWRDPCRLPYRSLGQVEPSTSQPTTNLTNEAEWEIWKSNMDMSQDSESHGYQLALFLYCALI